MVIGADQIFDFSNFEELSKVSRKLVKDFKTHSGQNLVNSQEYRDLRSNSEFLLPTYICWRKEVDAIDLLSSAAISDKRKKIIRQAISQSINNGIIYSIENPLSLSSFNLFLDFYNNYNQSHGYDLYLKPGYLDRHLSENTFLIKITDSKGEFLGGRLIYKYKNNLSTEYRAISRTKLVKEGYDTVCEKLYYDLAVKEGVKYLGRGKELNIRGIGNRHIGMIWNKLKYGYVPTIKNSFPRVYADFAFLKNTYFDLVFFISIENKPKAWEKKEQLVLNFICGVNPNWEEINAVIKKSMFPIRVWNMDFQLINELMPVAIS